jgi:hypothetical protein
MANGSTDMVVIVNLHAIIGGKCRWTQIGEPFCGIQFYVAECGDSGSVSAIVNRFEYCPFCGLEILLK